MPVSSAGYSAPTTVDELLLGLATHGEKAKILAGGTDLLLQLQDRKSEPRHLLDVSRLSEIQGLEETPDGGLRIGAGVKIRALERTAVVKERYYALHQATVEFGSPQVRAMATIGGNCCNASPAAETPTPLISLGAQAILVSPRGKRTMPLEDFILGNRRTAMASDEFMEAILLPKPWPRSASRYAYMGLREAVEIDLVSVAVNVALAADGAAVESVRVVMGAVGATPLRAQSAERILAGRVPDEELYEQAAEAAAADARPIDDFRASAAYRRHLVKVLTGRVLREAIGAAREGWSS